MKKIVLILLLALILFGCDTNRKKPPMAKNGVLDLRDWDFEKDGNVYMYGEWEFYWKKLLKPEDLKNDSIKPDLYIIFPGLWDTLKINNRELGSGGYATFKLKIKPPKNQKHFGFFFWSNFASGRIYVNDNLFATMGVPDTSFEKTVFAYSRYPCESFITEKDEIDLIIQVANFNVSHPGVPTGWRFQITNFEQYFSIFSMSYGMHIASIGILFIIGLYHLIIFIYRRDNKLALFFSLLCISIASENFLIAGLIHPLYPYIDRPENFALNQFLTIYLLGFVSIIRIILFLYFFKLYFHESFSKKFFYFIIIFCNAFILYYYFVIINQMEGWVYFNLIFLITIIYCFYITVKAFIKRKEGSMGLLIGYILFLIFFLNSFFQPIGFTIITELYTTNVALVCLTGSMAIVLARNFSTAFKTVETQAVELQHHKEHLEELVDERTLELTIEKDKSDKLLLNVLPEQIAHRLKQGETPIADHFEEASVIFIDIADFTKLSARSKPQDMVKMLNDIFSIFDKISDKYGLEKIKTIGDCFMAAAGIPIPRKDHAEAIAKMAIEVMDTMKGYRVSGIGDRVLGIGGRVLGIGFGIQGIGDGVSETQNPIPETQEIQFRIGLDCGPIVAGVIGEQKFIYDLWGDMVNTASRMETNGVVGKIQCTERFKNKLTIDNGQLKMKFEERGEIEIKGKGIMKTYFLVNSH
ncbi:MAG: adenylate/guanylate cyclase domain-containing protein [bacterium]